MLSLLSAIIVFGISISIVLAGCGLVIMALSAIISLVWWLIKLPWQVYCWRRDLVTRATR